MKLLKDLRIVTMEGQEIPLGYLLVDQARIVDLGSMEDCPTDVTDVTVLRGKTAYPGFIDAHSHIGMWEDGLSFEGDDGNEDCDPIMPQLSALDAINPMDRAFSEAATAGITTVVTGPGSDNPIGGSFIAVKTVGRRIDDMVVKNPVGMKFSLGENPKNTYHEKDAGPVTRMGTAALIREQLERARRYTCDLESALQDEGKEEPEYDAKCEALVPIFQRKGKAFFHCHRADDIFTALRIGKEFHLDVVLVHATEGHLVADLLQEESIIVGPLMSDRSKPELKNQCLKNPAVLKEEGALVAICTDHPVIPQQYLPLSCALAVREGLSRQDAFHAVTIDAARVVGIEDRVGSLAVGKDADLVIYPDNVDPFSPYTVPERVMIDGEWI